MDDFRYKNDNFRYKNYTENKMDILILKNNNWNLNIE